MLFSEFINKLINCFNNALKLVSNIISIIINNNFIKLIIYTAVMYFIFYLFSELINIIINLFKNHKNENDNSKVE